MLRALCQAWRLLPLLRVVIPRRSAAKSNSLAGRTRRYHFVKGSACRNLPVWVAAIVKHRHAHPHFQPLRVVGPDFYVPLSRQIGELVLDGRSASAAEFLQNFRWRDLAIGQ